jgi:flagellin-like protein
MSKHVEGELMRGLSPIISVVLLIGLTVAVGAVISIWLLSFTRETSTDVSGKAEKQVNCAYGGIALSKLTFCSNYLWGRIENTGQINLENITLQIIKDSTTSKLELCEIGTEVKNCTSANLSLPVNELRIFNISFSSKPNEVIVITNCEGVKDRVKEVDISEC